MVMVQYRMECLFYGDWTVFLQNDENNCDMHEHALSHRHQERWIVWHKELWTVWLEYEVIQSQEKTHWYKCTSTILSRHFWNSFKVILNS